MLYFAPKTLKNAKYGKPKVKRLILMDKYDSVSFTNRVKLFKQLKHDS